MSQEPQNLDRLFGALSDPTRRAILARLAAEGETTISDLARPFRMSLPAISKHVRVLEKAGLLHREVRGRERRCSLLSQPLKDASEWLEGYRRFWEGQLDSLARFLEKEGNA